MKKCIKILLIIILTASVAVGCKVEKVRVCGTIYPVQYLLERIGGNRINTCTLSDNQQVINSQMVPNYKSLTQDVDAIFHLGDVEPFLSLYTAEFNAQEIPLINVSANALVNNFKYYSVEEVNGEDQYVEKDWYDGAAAFEDVDMYSIDPYVWLDPIAYTSVAKNITDYLIKLAPLDRDYFNSNFVDLQSELSTLDAQLNVFKDEGISFVSITPSFGNWQKTYGIDVAPAILSKYGVTPNSNQLAVITNWITENKIKYIAFEDGLNDSQKATYDYLVKEHKLEPINLYNLSFITEEQLTQELDYLDLMYRNLDALIEMSK